MVSLKAKQAEEALLLGVAPGAASADRDRPLPVAVAGAIDDTLDLAEGLHEGVEGRRLVRGGVADLAVEPRAEQQGKDAVRSVDGDLLVGPVQWGAPTDELRVFICVKTSSIFAWLEADSLFGHAPNEIRVQEPPPVSPRPERDGHGRLTRQGGPSTPVRGGLQLRTVQVETRWPG